LVSFLSMGVCQGVAVDSLKFHPCSLCPTLLRPAGGPLLKRPYGRLRGDPPTGQVGCGYHLPFWTPHTVRLCSCHSNDFRHSNSLVTEQAIEKRQQDHESDLPSTREAWAYGHGLPKVSPGPHMLYPSTPCGQANPEAALLPMAVSHPFGYPPPYAYEEGQSEAGAEQE
jgi:hypothetical protein